MSCHINTTNLETCHHTICVTTLYKLSQIDVNVLRCIRTQTVLPDFSEKGHWLESYWDQCNRLQMWLKWWTLKHVAHVMEIPVINTPCHSNRHKGKAVPLQVMMACRGHRGIAPVILDLALDGDELSASCPRASLDIFGQRKVLLPLLKTKSWISHLKTNSLHWQHHPGSHWLIDCNWVQDLTVPLHLGLN